MDENSEKDFLDEWLEEIKDEEGIELEDKGEVYLHHQDIIDEASKTLNNEQLEVFNDVLYSFLKSKTTDYAVIRGFAGSGKSYLISKIIKAFSGRVAMSAPTNKATAVLRDMGFEDKDVQDAVEYATIHKLLALMLKWVFPKDKRQQPYQKLIPAYRSKPLINSFDLLIVDEVSMMDDELFGILNSEKDNKLKVIFLGDPAQIPPIGKIDSIPLMKEWWDAHPEESIKRYTLTEMMRQGDNNSIVETAYQIRNNRFTMVDPIINRVSSKNVTYFNKHRHDESKAFHSSMLGAFRDVHYKDDINSVKVLAWRNKTVDNYNKLIRHAIYGSKAEMNPFLENEMLIADKPIFSMEYEKDGITYESMPVAQTSSELQVITSKHTTYDYTLEDTGKKNADGGIILPDQSELELGSKILNFNIECYELLVQPIKSMEKYKILVLNPHGKKKYESVLRRLKALKKWDEFIRLTEYFARVKYAYTITTHKSQGSTYKKTFIIEDDIFANRNLLEKNRILYTAITRASDHVFSLTTRSK